MNKLRPLLKCSLDTNLCNSLDIKRKHIIIDNMILKQGQGCYVMPFIGLKETYVSVTLRTFPVSRDQFNGLLLTQQGPWIMLNPQNM